MLASWFVLIMEAFQTITARSIIVFFPTLFVMRYLVYCVIELLISCCQFLISSSKEIMLVCIFEFIFNFGHPSLVLLAPVLFGL